MAEEEMLISRRLAYLSSFLILFVLLSPFVSSESESDQQILPKNCQDSWVVGDSDNISTSEGTIAATVERVSSNSAIFVEDVQIVSSTTINDIVSSWESIIFPTNTNFFGEVPDIDLNCQVEIVIYSIDGPGGDNGGFEEGLSSVREVIFLDVDDLASRNQILSHELEHMIHFSKDQFE